MFNWKKVGVDGDGSSFYVDVDSIKKHNGLVYYWRLIDHIEPTEFGDYSIITKYKVDCVEEKQTWLNITFYSQSMGRGKIITETTPNDVRYPKPKVVGYIVMKFACNNAR